MTNEIVEATMHHAEELSRTIRADDKREVEALGVTVDDALEHGVRRGANAFLVDGEVVCIFGLNRLMFWDPEASPWMLTSNALEDHKIAFLRESVRISRAWKAANTYLWNYVDARHTASIEWLVWLGFTIHPAEKINGHLFHYFDWAK
jgi:hypothetical protein